MMATHHVDKLAIPIGVQQAVVLWAMRHEAGDAGYAISGGCIKLSANTRSHGDRCYDERYRCYDATGTGVTMKDTGVTMGQVLRWHDFLAQLHSQLPVPRKIHYSPSCSSRCSYR